MRFERCARKGCKERAHWMACIVMPPPVGSHPDPESVALKGYMDTLVVCDAHRSLCTAEALITDEGWARIMRGLPEGIIRPRREDARVDTVPIGEGRCFFAKVKGDVNAEA